MTASSCSHRRPHPGHDPEPRHSPLFYQLLRAHGDLGPDAPAAIEMFSGRGQPSCEQLIDRYRIACRPVRDVLVDYLRERQPSVDFSTLQRLAYLLGKLFWADLEAHHPGIDSLQLSREVAAAWKQRVTRPAPRPHPTANKSRCGRGWTGAACSPRCGPSTSTWPSGPTTTRPAGGRGRCGARSAPATPPTRRTAHTASPAWTRAPANGCRCCRPWSPGWRPNGPHRRAARRRRAGRPGELFTAAGVTLRRSVLKTETDRARLGRGPRHRPAPRPQLRRTPRVLDLGRGRSAARHRGSVEELTELSHHSLIQYRLPATGELIPLLQITPSKTDAERLLVISPELADVLSTIVAASAAIGPTCRWWCPTTRTNASTHPPVPLLFQWRRRLEPPARSPTVLLRYLDHALTEIGVKTPPANRCATPSTTSAGCSSPTRSMHGMPPHIAQLVAGHRDINTTMGYKAVYPEEVINGHRAFIARRRALRSVRGIPHPHRRGMGRVRRPLPTPQGRHRRLRPLLRHRLHPLPWKVQPCCVTACCDAPHGVSCL